MADFIKFKADIKDYEFYYSLKLAGVQLLDYDESDDRLVLPLNFNKYDEWTKLIKRYDPEAKFTDDYNPDNVTYDLDKFLNDPNLTFLETSIDMDDLSEYIKNYFCIKGRDIPIKNEMVQGNVITFELPLINKSLKLEITDIK